MTPLESDPNVTIKVIMSVTGAVILLLFSQGCVGRTGGLVLGNNEFWETQHDIVREVNRPGQIEVIEDLKLTIRRPKKGGK